MITIFIQASEFQNLVTRALENGENGGAPLLAESARANLAAAAAPVAPPARPLATAAPVAPPARPLATAPTAPPPAEQPGPVRKEDKVCNYFHILQLFFLMSPVQKPSAFKSLKLMLDKVKHETSVDAPRADDKAPVSKAP